MLPFKWYLSNSKPSSFISSLKIDWYSVFPRDEIFVDVMLSIQIIMISVVAHFTGQVQHKILQLFLHSNNGSVHNNYVSHSWEPQNDWKWENDPWKGVYIYVFLVSAEKWLYCKELGRAASSAGLGAVWPPRTPIDPTCMCVMCVRRQQTVLHPVHRRLHRIQVPFRYGIKSWGHGWCYTRDLEACILIGVAVGAVGGCGFFCPESFAEPGVINIMLEYYSLGDCQ